MTKEVILTPQILLRAYSLGLFPMAEGKKSDEIYWYDPDPRGVLPIERFHVPRRLKDKIRRSDYQIKVNYDFRKTMRLCGSRTETWINEELIDVYTDLHNNGFAHSLEVWRHDEMVGGIYGVHIGAAFFGESMFSFQRDMSKVALTHLMARLWWAGFVLFDTQFLTPHLQQFGGYELSQKEYKSQLSQAIKQPCDMLGDDFTLCDYSSEESLLSAFMHSRTQMS